MCKAMMRRLNTTTSIESRSPHGSPVCDPPPSKFCRVFHTTHFASRAISSHKQQRMTLTEMPTHFIDQISMPSFRIVVMWTRKEGLGTATSGRQHQRAFFNGWLEQMFFASQSLPINQSLRNNSGSTTWLAFTEAAINPQRNIPLQK
jgi:hypothetical protein